VRLPRVALGAVAVGAAFALVLLLLRAVDAPRTLVLAVDDVAQLAAAAAATWACARVAHRGSPERRREWLVLAAGLGCWTGGQLLWTVDEVVLGREVPFPSWADAGFLGFTLLAPVALSGWLRGRHRAAARWRDALDGGVIATSLLAVYWVTTLSGYAAGTEDALHLVLSLAYPVGDVVMATVVLLTVARVAAADRATLVLLATGLGGLTVADSAYLALVTAADYGTGDLLSAGWVTGFGLIAAAARHATQEPGPTTVADRADRAEARVPAAGRLPSRALVALPYVPLTVAGAVVVDRLLAVPGAASAELGLGLVLVLLVLARQLVALAENGYLVAALQRAHDDVRRQALHDPLTGLANRVLFTDRLEHALAVQHETRPEPSGPPHPQPAAVSVLYCDLDGFKAVNDRYGHDGGDELLRQVAHRLQTRLGPGDTLARLGGDEFAVLLEGPADAGSVAQRLVEAVDEPFHLAGRPARVTLSVGVASATAATAGDEPLLVSRRLLRDADRAMYAAKGAGKGRAAVAPATPATPPVPSTLPGQRVAALPGR
jgi:diguanylate cyclase